MPTLAALTPSDIEVILTDENVEPIDFDEKIDLVGITGMTCLIPRSYEIADEFRKRGVPVVLGGIHVSMLPEEAAQHCDSVVIGEAEDIWEKVLIDARLGKLQKFYKAPKFPDLTKSPVPRWDLLKNDKYCYFTIQSGRGCPYDCEFCSVKVFNGREYRHKNVEKVIDEIKILQNIDNHKLIFFTDDNLLSIPHYAETLVQGLIPLKIKTWMCQSSMNRLNDEKLLKLMYAAGCKVIFIGFESVSQTSIETINKNMVNNPATYAQIIQKVHAEKISIFGSFIFGTDSDKESIFEDTAKFIETNGIAFSMLNIMTLLPGTRLFERLKNENRILNFKWWQSNADWACFKPKLMTKETLEAQHKKTLEKIYSYPAMYKRLSKLWNNGIFVREDKTSRFTKTRIFFTFLSLVSLNLKKTAFLLRSLWYKKCTSIMWVMTAMNYHNYANNLKNDTRDL
ncbi:MAG: radical SAM protein [Candidatus Omnitrophica bacterium]|nr:radical SAM protein [Candidatus Omnitrophota bacterium]